MTHDTTLDATSTRFATALTATGRVRVRLDQLWIVLQTAAPELLTSATKRERLAAILQALADAGVYVLPKSPSLWDRTGRPPLPAFVRVAQPLCPSGSTYCGIRGCPTLRCGYPPPV